MPERITSTHINGNIAESTGTARKENFCPHGTGNIIHPGGRISEDAIAEVYNHNIF